MDEFEKKYGKINDEWFLQHIENDFKAIRSRTKSAQRMIDNLREFKKKKVKPDG